MSFYSCPYCKKNINKYNHYGLWLLVKPNKKCEHCSGKIKVSFFGFLILCILVPLGFFVLFILSLSIIDALYPNLNKGVFLIDAILFLLIFPYGFNTFLNWKYQLNLYKPKKERVSLKRIFKKRKYYAEQ